MFWPNFTRRALLALTIAASAAGCAAAVRPTSPPTHIPLSAWWEEPSAGGDERGLRGSFPTWRCRLPGVGPRQHGSSSQLAPTAEGRLRKRAGHLLGISKAVRVNTCTLGKNSPNELRGIEAARDDIRKRIGECRRAASMHSCVHRTERPSLCPRPHSNFAAFRAARARYVRRR